MIILFSDLRAGLNILSDSDIHAVTGVLKLYFRELPEPLFTEESYPQFVDSIGRAFAGVFVLIFFKRGLRL